jgi:ribosomal protein S18 acetylase RimI-like enzyme
VWISDWIAEGTAQLRAFALRDDWSVGGTLNALLPPVRSALREEGVAQLAYVGAERWLLDSLSVRGFQRINTILTMQKSDFLVPSPGNCRVALRPVGRDDLDDILAIDAVAFVPLWRNTVDSLLQALSQCPFFVLAQMGDAVIGYAQAAILGQHGHLSRIAVRPDARVRGVGVRLLAETVRFFESRGAYGITLNTQQDNDRARRLYEWFGFSMLGAEAEVLVSELDAAR